MQMAYYNQDCSLTYGPMKFSDDISSYRHLKYKSNKIKIKTL